MISLRWPSLADLCAHILSSLGAGNGRDPFNERSILNQAFWTDKGLSESGTVTLFRFIGEFKRALSAKNFNQLLIDFASGQCQLRALGRTTYYLGRYLFSGCCATSIFKTNLSRLEPQTILASLKAHPWGGGVAAKVSEPVRTMDKAEVMAVTMRSTKGVEPGRPQEVRMTHDERMVDMSGEGAPLKEESVLDSLTVQSRATSMRDDYFPTRDIDGRCLSPYEL
ncbi:hypothetical protein PILCRDRAFT_87217 [Piloderma croceum F 1598]|uniref:Uncharacterized protein n=1 Tax=Piloderma croceum (strain F 1598) TaxID=765440 RepID=A0A0C3FLB8_PILCF|nr:hypothetical protein PILCRDRAFT_87217 [Piloderma croceum F 1598]